MMQRVEVLSGKIDALLKQHKAAKAEIVRLTRALDAAKAARDKAQRELEVAKRDANRLTLAALPVTDELKPQLRKSLDTLIAEIDTILMQLHD